MRRSRLLVAALVLAWLSAGCFEVNVDVRDELVRGRLNTWAAQVFDWQTRTWQVLCTVATVHAQKDANGTPLLEQTYGQQTLAYCGPGNGGNPDDPPDWGDE